MKEKSSLAMISGGLRTTLSAPTSSVQMAAANSACSASLTVGAKLMRTSTSARAP